MEILSITQSIRTWHSVTVKYKLFIGSSFVDIMCQFLQAFSARDSMFKQCASV